MTLTFKHVSLEYKHVQLKDRESMKFYMFDLDPMTFVLKLDLDMFEMYLHTKMKFLSIVFLKL